MKVTSLKFIYVLLVVLLLGMMVIAPAAAQGPGEDVEAQLVGFAAFLWNPADTFVSRGDGTVTTKLDVQGASDISGMTLAIGYDASVISPQKVVEGDLLPGTRGVDYFMTVITGGGALGCGGDSSFTVEIAYLDPNLSINGTGSLLDILWRSDPDAAVGDVGTVCLDGWTSLVVDNGGFPGPPVPDVNGTITVEPATIFKFQIALEGGQNSGLDIVASPEHVFTEVIINGIYPCDGGGVDILGFCAFNNATTGAPYTIEVSRRGYLDATSVLDDAHDSGAIWLLAGDLNDDDIVNILDIVLMASLLNQPVGTSTVSNAADYTGPPPGLGLPPAPDGLINIIDLVLMAKNFGLGGPTDGSQPGNGTFPF